MAALVTAHPYCPGESRDCVESKVIDLRVFRHRIDQLVDFPTT